MMVVAFCRGLLRPDHKYGQRSIAAENVVLEALSADLVAGGMQALVSADMAMIPALSEKGVNLVVEKSNKRLQRASELRLFDVYRVAEQIEQGIKVSKKDELSLFQLYQIAEKSGIFQALDEHYTIEKSRPLF